MNIELCISLTKYRTAILAFHGITLTHTCALHDVPESTDPQLVERGSALFLQAGGGWAIFP